VTLSYRTDVSKLEKIDICQLKKLLQRYIKNMTFSFSNSRQLHFWPLFVVLITLCLPAHARWETMGLYPIGMFYIDTASVVREGDHRKLLSTLDYREAQKSSEGKKFLSTRSQLHIDCKQELVRTLHLTMFAGPMLSGAVVESEGILQEWQLIPTGTPMRKIWSRVC
jgi:hypothetical protein